MIFQTKNPNEVTSDTCICFIFEDDMQRGSLFEALNNLSQGKLEEQIEYGAIQGKIQETLKYSINQNIKVLLVGLGKKQELTRQKFSQCVASAARIAKNMSQNSSLALELIENQTLSSPLGFNKKDCAILALSALRIGLYEYTKYLSNKNPKIDVVEIVDEKITQDIEEGVQIGAYTSFAMKFTKDLVNEPAQNATPEYIANVATQIAKEYGLNIRIFNKNQIKDMGMNAFLAVAQGSDREPKFVHMTYKPKTKPKKKVALVGKGITFDGGGMNIKTAQSMLTMKSDMTGAATVLGVIQAVSKLNLPIELHVVCALCENMPSGSAYKQGDVLRAMNGKTIEVDNTDAEGRITLADALSYCDELGVDEVIDIATLTGAVIVSLGHNITGVMGNNQEQIDKFINVSKLSAENTWQMPILEELKDNLKSEIADFKNTGGRNAGTSTAAWFLSNFTKSSSWLHLDIAGTAYLDKTNKETLSGPTGVMVRTLVNYLLSL